MNHHPEPIATRAERGRILDHIDRKIADPATSEIGAGWLREFRAEIAAGAHLTAPADSPWPFGRSGRAA